MIIHSPLTIIRCRESAVMGGADFELFSHTRAQRPSDRTDAFLACVWEECNVHQPLERSRQRRM